MRSLAIPVVLASVLAFAAAPGCKVTTRREPGGPAAILRSGAPSPAAPTAAPERAAAPVERVEVDPEAAAALKSSGRLPAKSLEGAPLLGGLTTVALLDTSRTEARGMTPDGGVRQVDLDEGQRASIGLDVVAGECLTVVTHAGLGIREVDAFLVAPAAPDGEVLAQDRVGGPLAVVGGQTGCVRVQRAQRLEVVVLARKGRGTVVTAIFRGAPLARDEGLR